MALSMALAVMVGVVAVGSIIEINAQSAPFRRSVAQGFADLASRVVAESNRTGSQLADLIQAAPTLPNQPSPFTARGQLQYGLDAAVSSTTQQVTEAKTLTPPAPMGDTAAKFVGVLADRATAVIDLRSTIDRLFGLDPLPVAGAPPTVMPGASSMGALISMDEASTEMIAEGVLIQKADADLAALVADLRRGTGTGIRSVGSIRLPSSVWAPHPVGSAILGSTHMGLLAGELESSAALVPFHRTIVTAIGLSPPAVPIGSAKPNGGSGGAGVVGDSCNASVSTVAGATPTVLPPTSVVTVVLTVTNCGTVIERGIGVSANLALADPSGLAPPPNVGTDTSAATATTVSPGESSAVTLGPLGVASGHRYDLTVSVAAPVSQADLAGTTHQFFLQIAI
jgi:hypothetical protein